MFRILSIRLTLLYTLLFSILAFTVFIVIYHNLSNDLMLRVDTEIVGDAHELGRIYREEGLEVLLYEAQKEASEEGRDRAFFRIYSPARDVVLTSDLTDWNIQTPVKLLNSPLESRFDTIKNAIHGNRARVIYHNLGDDYVVQIGTTLEQDDYLLENFINTFIFAFVLMLITGAGIGGLMARRALAGIEKVRQSADRISRGDLSQPIPTNGDSREVENLIQSFNRMQERIQTLIHELHGVTNNVAHDLRSPVTRMRGIAETTLTGSQSIEEYRDLASAVIEESDRLVGIINTMLEIAETDAGVRPLPGEQVDLTEIVHDVADLYASVAEDKGISFNAQIPSTQLFVTGDRSRLQRAFANLLDNALKFTPKDGQVTITLCQEGERALVIFDDNGPGISAENLPRIYDRFYRGERSRTTSGSGLGLSLVKAIVHVHGGHIDVASTPDQGSRFTISLPL